MGFVRTNWLVLVTGLTLQSLWQYFVSTLPHLVEMPLGPDLNPEMPFHGWRAVFFAIGGWVELPGLLIVAPLKYGWLSTVLGFAVQWATWVLLLVLARRLFRLTHRYISAR